MLVPVGADDGNRTHTDSLGSCSSTIKLHLHLFVKKGLLALKGDLRIKISTENHIIQWENDNKILTTFKASNGGGNQTWTDTT